MNRRLSFAAILVASDLCFAASAWPRSQCKYEAERSAEVGAAGATAVVIIAGAGDLKIRGIPQGVRVRALGKACAPSQASLDKTGISVRREGDAIVVESAIPTAQASPAKAAGISHPYIDVRIELPANLPISLRDSSGDGEIVGIAGGKIVEDAGDLDVRDVIGSLDVTDAAGDIRVGGVGGKLTLSDASGDVLISDVKGDVLITQDGSGDITILRSGANVTVLRDSAGELKVAGVAGNFDLQAKGSGPVHVSGVHGTTRLPDRGQVSK